MSIKVAAGTNAIKNWLNRAEISLGNHSARLDAINIFPVADADTGTNLYRTVRTAARSASSATTPDLGQLLRKSGQEAMEHARGNSGTIFAVFLSAFGEALDSHTRLSSLLLAQALERAQIRCWSALMDPVPGTMLSVLAGASEAAKKALGTSAREESARGSSSGERSDTNPMDTNQLLAQTLHAVVEGALEAVKYTETQLDTLTQAEVVDAGALGMLLILDALRTACLGAGLEEDSLTELSGYGLEARQLSHTQPVNTGVEVMATIALNSLDAAMLRSKLDEIGDSVIMSAVNEIEGGFRWRVHVHVPESEIALKQLRAAGEPRSVSITTLGTQHEHSTAEGDPCGRAS